MHTSNSTASSQTYSINWTGSGRPSSPTRSTLMEVINWIKHKNHEQVPQIKRLRNVHELKKMPGEGIVNYENRIKKNRKVAGYDELTPEQSRVLYVILTTGDQKFMDECLNQVTNRLDLLTSALLPKV